MKKSMAGKGAAGALLLAGVMMSTGAMAASGDQVTGGSGTVTINVPIVTSTCSVKMPTVVNFDQIDKNSPLTGVTWITAKKFDTVFSNCIGKTLKMTVQGKPVSDSLKNMSFFDSGDPDHVFSYYIAPPEDAEIKDAGLIDSILALDNTHPVVITPGSDNYTMSSTVYLFKRHDSTANLGSVVSTSFTYNITYQ